MVGAEILHFGQLEAEKMSLKFKVKFTKTKTQFFQLSVEQNAKFMCQYNKKFPVFLEKFTFSFLSYGHPNIKNFCWDYP